MAKVLIRSKKRPAVTKRVHPRLAELLIKRGWAYVEDMESAAGQYGTTNLTPDYGAMTYADLRALAKERGVEPEGRTKVDYIEALQRGGRYLRRDMRAEE